MHSRPAKYAATKFAVPSCVLPATLAENIRFLAETAHGRIAEIGLCFFETQACLAYTEEDLPPELATFGLHIHLPVDLPWRVGPEAAANVCLRLVRKVEAVAPVRAAVLHAPEGRNVPGMLSAFASLWLARKGPSLLFENTDTCSLVGLTNLIEDAELGICLDMAHMAAYGQSALADSPLLARAGLVHWSAPGGADRHLSLARLTPEERKLMRETAKKLPADVVHMPEIFDWNGVEESLTVLPELITNFP